MKTQFRKTGIPFVMALILVSLFSFASAKVVVIPTDEEFFVIPVQPQYGDGIVYFNDFSSDADGHRIDQFVAYRDPFVVAHTAGRSDHASTGGINCTAPEQTRLQIRGNPYAHVYQCLPGGQPDAGHQMAFAMDTSGYGFAGALPNQVFEGVSEVSLEINATNAGGRNFVEIKIIPADSAFVNGLPCIPDLPCNSGWDYNDIGAVGASTRMEIGTPTQPDGYTFDSRSSFQLDNGDTQYNRCSTIGFCFKLRLHDNNVSIRDRYQHIFRDNGNGTVAFGIESTEGHFDWVEAPGSFPNGPVRVVIAFHNYTGTKSGSGPGFNGNLSPSEGGFTWHWDDLAVKADKSTPSFDYFGGYNAERIVTPDNCISFSQGQRASSNNNDVGPLFHCEGDGDLGL